MKKTLIVISSVLVVIGVFTSSSFAHGGGHGRGHSRHAQVWTATLTVPGATGATGNTGPTGEEPLNRRRGGSSHHSYDGATGATGSTAPTGKVLYVQNKKRYAVGARVKNLTPSTTYKVAIYTNTDGKGCSSPTNTALNPPAIPAIVTNAAGNGQTSAKGLRTEVSLDKTLTYYVSVTDSSGAVVLCGDLTSKSQRGHGHGTGGCGSHGSTGETGATGVDSRVRGHH